jgi:hypothetical protein
MNKTEIFIEKAKLIHGNKYDYSLVNYAKCEIKIDIICKIHGIFKQSPNGHLNGNGCMKCSGKKQLNNVEFIEKSHKIHGYLYNYDKVIYKNRYTNVIITCKEHGEFLQKPNSHFLGYGCSKCSGKIQSNTEEFIEKSKLIHNNIYNYKKTIYIDSMKKVIIICNEHGEFSQTPNSHLSGRGCKKCNSSKGEIKIENILKENNVKYIPQYSFQDLYYKQILYFDFAIFINNKIKFLIEFNGEQHYKFNNFMHKTKENFEICKYRDQLKVYYCKYNNIPLFTIKYNDNLNDKMNEILDII